MATAGFREQGFWVMKSITKGKETIKKNTIGRMNYGERNGESMVPLCRRWMVELIWRAGCDRSLCAVTNFLWSDETGSCCSCWAEPSRFPNRGALTSFLPVEKKMTDSLGGAWRKVLSSSSSSSSSSLLHLCVSAFSSLGGLFWKS